MSKKVITDDLKIIIHPVRLRPSRKIGLMDDIAIINRKNMRMIGKSGLCRGKALSAAEGKSVCRINAQEVRQTEKNYTMFWRQQIIVFKLST